MPKKSLPADKKSHFHKHFMTVTPLSKTIALLLFILLPILAFAMGMRYQRALDQFMVVEQMTVTTTTHPIVLSAMDNATTKYVRVGDVINTPNMSLKSSNNAVVKSTQDGHAFVALKQGEVTLSGTLKPACKPGNLCPQIMIVYSVDIVVK